MSVKFTVKTSGLEAIDYKIAEAASTAEVWLANEVLKDTDKYVPMLTGSLSQRSHVEGNMIVYPGPYARYLYFGKVMAGPPEGPKVATDKDLVYTKQAHPDAQSHWFEASKAQNLDKWLRGVKKLIEK
jgi:hypothetical protein